MIIGSSCRECNNVVNRTAYMKHLRTSFPGWKQMELLKLFYEMFSECRCKQWKKAGAKKVSTFLRDEV